LLSYPSTITLSTRALTHLADLIRARRNAVGSRWRKLPADRQALLVLAWLRNGDTYARLAGGFGIGVATAYRYLREAVDLLAATAPTLAQVLDRVRALVWVILDGTLIATDRVAEDRPYFSGKHRRHGVNAQVLAGPRGHLLWASPVLPGSIHDLKAARTHGIVDALTAAEITTWADRGYQGAGGTISTPFKRRPGHELSDNMRAVNAAHNAIRGKGERAIAVLKTWRILTKIRCDPSYTTSVLQAITVLQHVEDQRS
jgi:hypothetical protein